MAAYSGAIQFYDFSSHVFGINVLKKQSFVFSTKFLYDSKYYTDVLY